MSEFPPLKVVAAALGGDVSGGQVLAPALGHSQRDRSLSVKIDPAAPDGLLVHTFANDDALGNKRYVMRRLGIEPQRCRGNKESATNGGVKRHQPKREQKPDKAFEDIHLLSDGYQHVATYHYKVKDELVYQILRYEHPTKGKTFRARRPAGGDGWLKGAGERRVLYRLDDLNRVAHDIVFITEGERDADRLAALDFVAVTVAFGQWREECITALEGREAFILEDNDKAGVEKAQKAAAALHGVAGSVRIVRLPDLPERGDISDWLDADETRSEQLIDIAKQAPLWEPDEPQEKEEQPAGNGNDVSLLRWHGDEPIKQPAWLVQGVVPETGVALIAGQWSAGKTFIGVDLAISVAIGAPFAGSEVCRVGGTLWLAAEGDAEIEARVHAAAERKFKETGKGDLTRLPFARQAFDVPSLKAADALPKLLKMAEEAAKRMAERFGFPLALIVIDTVAAAAGFDDENSAAEAQKVMNVLHALSRATGALVAPIDHYGKLTETGVRGSSAKAASADAILAALADKDADGKVRNRRLAVAKLRGGATGRVIPFNLRTTAVGPSSFDTGGTTCFVDWGEATGQEPTSAKPQRPTWTGKARILKRAMQVALGEHGKTRRPFGSEGPEVRAVNREDVRAEFYRSYSADEASQATKRRNLNRLIDSAQEKNLIIARFDDGIDWLWFGSKADEEPTG